MKDNYFLNKKIIITGANQGIGNMIAKYFYSKGSNLILCARNKKKLVSSTKDFKTYFNNKLYLEKLDISKKKQVDLFFKKILKKHKTIHVLINNAGVLGPAGPSEKINWNKWINTIEINLLGSIYMINKIIPHFKKKNYGKIVQFSGGGSTSPLPYFSPYTVSKVGVVRFVENISHELFKYNITINSIAPGQVKTKMMYQILKAGPKKVGKEYYKKTKKNLKKGKSNFDKIISLVEFLSHENSDQISGKLLSAVWDNWEILKKKKYKNKIKYSDIGNLRRIIGKDRKLKLLDK